MCALHLCGYVSAELSKYKDWKLGKQARLQFWTEIATVQLFTVKHEEIVCTVLFMYQLNK